MAAFTSGALFFEAVDLAVPSTTDWSSLSLLLAGGEKTAEVKKEEKENDQAKISLPFPPETI